MTSRQQRTPALSRNVPLSSLISYAQNDWVAVRLSSTQLRIQVFEVQGPGTSEQINWQMSGVPPFNINNVGVLPTSAVQSGSYLVLDYTGPLPAGFTVYFPVFNDSLRTKFGAYLVGKAYQIVAPAPPPVNSVASFDHLTGNDVFLALTEPEGMNFMNNIPAYMLQPANESPTSAVLANNVVQLSYATTPVSADTVEIPVDDPHIRSLGDGYVATGTITIP
jgi:hypothetical protein